MPAIAAEDLEAVGPFLALAGSWGGSRWRWPGASSIDAVDVEYLGRIAERDTGC